MNRSLVPAAALAALLSGCPLPQPLPDYEATTVTPPRILADTVRVTGTNGEELTPVGGVYRVPADCTYPDAEPIYDLDVQVIDPNNTEGVPARWFVDYDPESAVTRDWVASVVIEPNDDETNLVRDVPTFTFEAYRQCTSPPCRTAGDLHVVEIVISNANGFFEPACDLEAEPLPCRSPAVGFETQVYSWTFQLVAGTEGCP